MTSDNEISAINFDRWCKINGELSESRLEAEKVITDSVSTDIHHQMITCYNRIHEAVGELEPLQEYKVRFAVARLTNHAVKLPLTYSGLLSSHGGDDSHDAPHNVVLRACDKVLEEEFSNLSELWKEVNT